MQSAADFPSEADIPKMLPAKLRFQEALYFYEKFKEHCGSSTNQVSSRFHWLAYADAFLMAIVSLQGMISKQQRDKLLQRGSGTAPNVFRVLKLIRDQTVHACVFAVRSASRIINVHQGRWEIAKIEITDWNAMLSSKRNNKLDVKEAENYLKAVKAHGKDHIRLEELFEEGIDSVRKKVPTLR